MNPSTKKAEWVYARPTSMLTKDLKELGFSDSQIKKLIDTKDQGQLRALASKMISEKREKEKDIKTALKKTFAWF